MRFRDRAFWAGVAVAAALGGGSCGASGSDAGDGEGCPVGLAGCPCTNGGACDPGLLCVGEVCTSPQCDIGSEGCPCTGGGSCDPGLVCQAGACVDPGGDTSESDGDGTSSSSNGDGDGDGDGDGTSSSTTTQGDGDGTSSSSTGDGDGDQTVEFHGVFLHNVNAGAQCDKWNNFRGQLAGKQFTKITMSGSEDPGGRSCVGPAADTICQAIFTNAALSIFCDGVGWNTGDCSGAPELDASSCVCCCGINYNVRPCHALNQWGGLLTEGCNTPSQTIDVVCYY